MRTLKDATENIGKNRYICEHLTLSTSFIQYDRSFIFPQLNMHEGLEVYYAEYYLPRPSVMVQYTSGHRNKVTADLSNRLSDSGCSKLIESAHILNDLSRVDLTGYGSTSKTISDKLL